jgi:hypothetical protein
LVVKVAEEVPTSEHRLGERHHHASECEAPLALLEQRSAAADRISDPEQLVKLGHQVEARSRGDPIVRCTKYHLALLLR